MKKLWIALFVVLTLVGIIKAADPALRRMSFIERNRLFAIRLVALMKDLREMKNEFDLNGYQGTFVEQDFIDSNNNHITPTEFTNALLSEQALFDLMVSSSNFHFARIYKLVK